MQETSEKNEKGECAGQKLSLFPKVRCLTEPEPDVRPEVNLSLNRELKWAGVMHKARPGWGRWWDGQYQAPGADTGDTAPELVHCTQNSIMETVKLNCTRILCT